MVPITLSRQKRDQIVWTDLIFRVPPQKHRTEVPKKEIRRTVSMAVTSNLRPCESSCRLGKKNPQKKSQHLRRDSVREEEAEVVKGPPPPPPSPTMDAPSASGNLAPQGKQKVASLLVDLRPILENVLDPSEEGHEEKDLKNEAHPSSDPGGSSSKARDPSEKAEEKDFTNGGRPFSNARDPSSEDHKTETTTTDSGDGKADQDILLPPIMDSCRNVRLAAETRKGICSPPDETMPLWRNDLQAVQSSQPKLSTPLSFPKISPQQQVLQETDSTRDHLRPTPPSPDFQLPTQLLLQRLQETTSSRNHLLIMQVLRSLREELLAENSNDGDKWNHLPELRVDNPRKGKPQASRTKPVAAKKEPGRLIWRRNRTFHAAGLDRRLQQPSWVDRTERAPLIQYPVYNSPLPRYL